MIVTYYGASCFKIQAGDVVLAFDPPSKKSEFKTPRFQADVVFVSHDHVGHNGSENISSKEKDSGVLVVSGPGEYEMRGMTAKGVLTFHDNKQGEKDGLNTLYIVSLAGINICHMGDYGERELRAEVQEFTSDIDVLLCPIGGDTTLELSQMIKIIGQIEPKIIIPMHYNSKGTNIDKKKLNEFLKEIGQEKAEQVEKFSFKKKDLFGKKEEVVVVKPLIN